MCLYPFKLTLKILLLLLIYLLFYLLFIYFFILLKKKEGIIKDKQEAKAEYFKAMEERKIVVLVQEKNKSTLDETDSNLI